MSRPAPRNAAAISAPYKISGIDFTVLQANDADPTGAITFFNTCDARGYNGTAIPELRANRVVVVAGNTGWQLGGGTQNGAAAAMLRHHGLLGSVNNALAAERAAKAGVAGNASVVDFSIHVPHGVDVRALAFQTLVYVAPPNLKGMPSQQDRKQAMIDFARQLRKQLNEHRIQNPIMPLFSGMEFLNAGDTRSEVAEWVLQGLLLGEEEVKGSGYTPLGAVFFSDPEYQSALRNRSIYVNVSIAPPVSNAPSLAPRPSNPVSFAAPDPSLDPSASHGYMNVELDDEPEDEATLTRAGRFSRLKLAMMDNVLASRFKGQSFSDAQAVVANHQNMRQVVDEFHSINNLLAEFSDPNTPTVKHNQQIASQVANWWIRALQFRATPDVKVFSRSDTRNGVRGVISPGSDDFQGVEAEITRALTTPIAAGEEQFLVFSYYYFTPDGKAYPFPVIINRADKTARVINYGDNAVIDDRAVIADFDGKFRAKFPDLEVNAHYLGTRSSSTDVKFRNPLNVTYDVLLNIGICKGEDEIEGDDDFNLRFALPSGVAYNNEATLQEIAVMSSALMQDGLGIDALVALHPAIAAPHLARMSIAPSVLPVSVNPPSFNPRRSAPPVSDPVNIYDIRSFFPLAPLQPISGNIKRQGFDASGVPIEIVEPAVVIGGFVKSRAFSSSSGNLQINKHSVNYSGVDRPIITPQNMAEIKADSENKVAEFYAKKAARTDYYREDEHRLPTCFHNAQFSGVTLTDIDVPAEGFFFDDRYQPVNARFTNCKLRLDFSRVPPEVLKTCKFDMCDFQYFLIPNGFQFSQDQFVNAASLQKFKDDNLGYLLEPAPVVADPVFEELLTTLSKGTSANTPRPVVRS
jgi:hypothetical protein